VSNDIYNLVRQAIENKQQVIATYDGHYREMCPHVIGTKRGRAQALFYQFGGTSRSGLGLPGSPDNWRCIPISKMTNVSGKDGEWHTATKHTRRQTCVINIDKEVAY
jgi:hypothetical protein